MPKGKQLFQLVIVGLSFIALVSSAIVACVLHDKDIFIGTAFGIAAVGFWSWIGDVWS